jgi:subtilase family serine protease
LSLKFYSKGGVKMKKGYLMVFIMAFVLTLGIGLTEAQADPDLVVSDLMVQDYTAAGIKIFITDVTSNVGTTFANPTITRYYLSTDTTISSSDVKLGDRYVPKLNQDVSNMGSNYVEIPGTVAPGLYYIIAKADALSYVLEPTKEGNNKRVKSIQIFGNVSANLPDLVVDVLSAPSPVEPGEVIYVTNKIKNLGPGDSLVSRAKLYLSSDCEIDSSDVLLVIRKVPPLAAGTSNQRQTPVTIPLATTPGSYYIVAEADAFDVNTEVNENNNVMCTSIEIALP